MPVRRYLRAALYELCWRRNNEGSEPARRASKEDFRKRVRSRRRVAEEREGSIVGHEQEGIERAVAEDRCCCAYAENRD